MKNIKIFSIVLLLQLMYSLVLYVVIFVAVRNDEKSNDVNVNVNIKENVEWHDMNDSIPVEIHRNGYSVYRGVYFRNTFERY